MTRPLFGPTSTALGQKKGPEQCQAIGRSRSGFTTKIHSTVNALGHQTVFHLKLGQAHGIEGADVLLQDTQADTVIAYKAYDVQSQVINPLVQAGKAVVIRPIRSHKHQRSHKRYLYKGTRVQGPSLNQEFLRLAQAVPRHCYALR